MLLLLLLLPLPLLCGWLAWRLRPGRGERAFATTKDQAKRLYSRRGFLRLGAGVAVSAALAYSGADEGLEQLHTDRVKGTRSNGVASFLHEFGERSWFAHWAAIAAIDAWVGSSPLSRFGRQTFETMLIGLPMLWGTQRGLGAARPKDETHGPRFAPLRDDNSASGHAFISAVPLFVAAQRLDSKLARNVARALTPLVGWSRINDRKHYTGQVLLGLLIAHDAAAATQQTDEATCEAE